MSLIGRLLFCTVSTAACFRAQLVDRQLSKYCSPPLSKSWPIISIKNAVISIAIENHYQTNRFVAWCLQTYHRCNIVASIVFIINHSIRWHSKQVLTDQRIRGHIDVWKQWKRNMWNVPILLFHFACYKIFNVSLTRCTRILHHFKFCWGYHSSLRRQNHLRLRKPGDW